MAPLYALGSLEGKVYFAILKNPVSLSEINQGWKAL